MQRMYTVQVDGENPGGVILQSRKVGNNSYIVLSKLVNPDPFEKRRPIFEMQRCIEKHYHIWFFGLESFPCTQMVFCIHSYQNLLFWPSNESSIITEKPGNVSFISNILQIGQKNNVHQCLVVWTGTSKNTLLSR